MGWTTPVELVVDGSVVDETELCVSPGNSRETTFSLTLTEGTHDVEVRVYGLEGTAFDLNAVERYVSDQQTASISVSPDARDPSEPTPGDRIGRWLSSLADSLGSSTTMVGLGALLAVGVFLFV
jgi:hypothetical protein